jgi:starch synthase
MMGFYPDCPGVPEYTLTTPTFDKVTVQLDPKYWGKKELVIKKEGQGDDKLLPQLKFVCHFYVNLNWRRQYVGIFTSQYDGVTYYFVDNEFYFAGDKPYDNIYEDVEKFAFFSKAVLEALPVIDFAPDVIHCNDWQTGLLPVFLKTVYGSDNFYAGIKTVFTIHNMKFQGRWKIKEVADVTGLPEHIFNSGELEFYGEANYLKGGIVYADEITTVSPTYADEICTPEGGEGLDGLMLERRRHLRGIVNGIDYDVFNPMKDTYLDKHFSVRELSGKVVNKRQLQEKYGLAVDKDVMLIGIVSRLTKQKGFDLVAYVMEEMLSTMNVQFIVQGTGEQQYEEMFNYFHGRYPQKLGVYIGYSEENAHEIYAGCDAFLMPSLFEPCGLSQLMSMRYGTLPIVRETGGLKDTVVPYNEYENTGDGFSFANYNAHDMLHVIKYALDVFENHKDRWQEMMQRAMRHDFSWKASAKEYEKLYDMLLGN